MKVKYVGFGRRVIDKDDKNLKGNSGFDGIDCRSGEVIEIDDASGQWLVDNDAGRFVDTAKAKTAPTEPAKADKVAKK